jgi:hypothetical protein
MPHLHGWHCQINACRAKEPQAEYAITLRQPRFSIDPPPRPGIRALNDRNQGYPHDVAKTTWTPLPRPFSLEPAHQPFFKLHGSWNWWSSDAGQMLVMGGNKVSAIQAHSLLRWYHEQFEAYLSEPDNRLMVIGYGYADPRINETILRTSGANPALSLFQVHPPGEQLFLIRSRSSPMREHRHGC